MTLGVPSPLPVFLLRVTASAAIIYVASYVRVVKLSRKINRAIFGNYEEPVWKINHRVAGQERPAVPLWAAEVKRLLVKSYGGRSSTDDLWKGDAVRGYK